MAAQSETVFVSDEGHYDKLKSRESIDSSKSGSPSQDENTHLLQSNEARKYSSERVVSYTFVMDA